MALYKFVAKDPSGKKFSGEVESSDEKALVITLQKEGLIPLDVRRRDKLVHPALNFLPKFGGVSKDEVVNFTRQLSTMISAGLPLADSLVILEKQTKSDNFRKILSEVLADVEGGMSLSTSLAKHPKAFNIIYTKLIEAGETGGVLDKILNKLAETEEKEKEFASKTKGAFIYPAIVIIVMIVVVGIMMVFVIPKLTTLYVEIGADLPLPTKILIGMSTLITKLWWLILICLIGLIFGLRAFGKTPKGADLFSRVAIAMPIWGKIKRGIILAQFTRTLGLLIGAGIPIITALKVVADILGSATFKEGIEAAIVRVERGSPLYQPIAANPAFPPIIAQMIRVGEETGKMDEVLTRLSGYFEEESESAIRNLTTALEPVILVILGLGVGVLVLSIILPIYNLTSQF